VLEENNKIPRTLIKQLYLALLWGFKKQDLPMVSKPWCTGWCHRVERFMMKNETI
jgi:hypothetical protein